MYPDNWTPGHHPRVYQRSCYTFANVGEACHPGSSVNCVCGRIEFIPSEHFANHGPNSYKSSEFNCPDCHAFWWIDGYRMFRLIRRNLIKNPL